MAAFTQEGRGEDFAGHALGRKSDMFGPDCQQDMIAWLEAGREIGGGQGKNAQHAGIHVSGFTGDVPDSGMKEIDLADKVGHRTAVGSFVKNAGRGDLQNTAAFHHRDPVRQ